MEDEQNKSHAPSTAPKDSKIKPMTQEDLRISQRNFLRFLKAARQGDEALQAEADRLYPRTPAAQLPAIRSIPNIW